MGGPAGDGAAWTKTKDSTPLKTYGETVSEQKFHRGRETRVLGQAVAACCGSILVPIPSIQTGKAGCVI